jgi:hypothetical protein
MAEAPEYANEFVPIFADITAMAAEDRKSLQQKIDALKSQHEQTATEIARQCRSCGYDMRLSFGAESGEVAAAWAFASALLGASVMIG